MQHQGFQNNLHLGLIWSEFQVLYISQASAIVFILIDCAWNKNTWRASIVAGVNWHNLMSFQGEAHSISDSIEDRFGNFQAFPCQGPGIHQIYVQHVQGKTWKD